MLPTIDQGLQHNSFRKLQVMNCNLQMKGTAISTTFFPTYITLSVGYHEICNNRKQAHLSSL